MRFNVADTLIPELEYDGSDLHVQATFSTEEKVLASYLTRGFGNSYDFDQTEHLEGLL